MSNGLEYTRTVSAWIIFVVCFVILWFMKPEVTVHESTMYLPLVTDRKAIDDTDVTVVRNDGYFFYKKIGYITITTPDLENNRSAELRTINQAKAIAANAGADIILVEGTRSTTWFDSGKKVFRLQAVAMSQS